MDNNPYLQANIYLDASEVYSLFTSEMGKIIDRYGLKCDPKLLVDDFYDITLFYTAEVILRTDDGKQRDVLTDQYRSVYIEDNYMDHIADYVHELGVEYWYGSETPDDSNHYALHVAIASTCTHIMHKLIYELYLAFQATQVGRYYLGAYHTPEILNLILTRVPHQMTLCCNIQFSE